jgi:2-iminobutanoate/2-iminopropanoate deaminase
MWSDERSSVAPQGDDRAPEDTPRDGSPRRLIVGPGSSLGGAGPLMADAVEWSGTLYLSGRADVDPATATVRSGDFASQASSVVADILRVLEEGGSSPDEVIRVECYLADAADFAAWNRVFAETFPRRPARTTLVTAFAVPGVLIELQVTAAVSR